MPLFEPDEPDTASSPADPNQQEQQKPRVDSTDIDKKEEQHRNTQLCLIWCTALHCTEIMQQKEGNGCSPGIMHISLFKGKKKKDRDKESSPPSPLPQAVSSRKKGEDAKPKSKEGGGGAKPKPGSPHHICIHDFGQAAKRPSPSRHPNSVHRVLPCPCRQK
ncbi:hypothetical protein MUK42_37009 [Musa troglodytarum]|uniref:Uncharacterized protein n=1 Tax=Musa troglodytarum TaxID=320322 RepID=A0A9E7KGM5_9LILI|nr:hypothetical protein MUK42_37009 [Musa troglodytarum]